MANGHGGARKPRKPAAVSGPGKLSRRTDGGPQQTQAQMTGMGYGENKDFMDIQSSAPLAATPSTPTVAPSAPAQTAAPQPAPLTQLFAPTERPNEPVTAGAPVGDGPGPVKAPMNYTLSDTFRRMAEADPTGDAEEMYNIVQRLGW